MLLAPPSPVLFGTTPHTYSWTSFNSTLRSSHEVAAQFADLYKVLNAGQIYLACTTSIIIWEWLSCLPAEWRYIWKAKWTPMKVLYLIVRYYTWPVLIMTAVFFYVDFSERGCAKILPVLPGLAAVIDLAIEAMLALRVYALYGGDKHMGMFLLTLLALFGLVMISVPILAFDYLHLPEWPGPCFLAGKSSVMGPKYIIAFYASPMMFDGIMTGLTMWKILERKRAGGLSSLLQVFIRDGLLYFVAITMLNMINVIFFLQPYELIQAINAPMSIHFSIVLSCRMVLNLRAKGDDSGNGVKQFSSSRGRWVTDVREGAGNTNYPLQPVNGGGHDSNSRVGQHVSQFGEDPKKSALPLAFSTMKTTDSVEPIPGKGIVVHWETEQWDSTKQEDDDVEETASQGTIHGKGRVPNSHAV